MGLLFCFENGIVSVKYLLRTGSIRINTCKNKVTRFMEDTPNLYIYIPQAILVFRSCEKF